MGGTHYTEASLRELAREFVYSGMSSVQFSKYKGYSTKGHAWWSCLQQRLPQLREYVREYTQERINALASHALQVELDLMDGAESENVRLSAAKDVMSRAGYDPVNKQEISSNEINITIGNEDKS